MPKTAKTHPADIADRQKIATATHFNVHLRIGPTHKINEEAPTLLAAIKAADRISAENSNKPAMIYAITPEGFTVFVPKDVIEEALADETMKRPLSGAQIAMLTAIMTGGGFKRANSKTAAEARFRKVATEHGIDDAKATDLLQGPFNFAELIVREKVSGKPASIQPEPAAREGSAPAKANDYPAPPKKPAKEKAERPAGKRAAILEAAQRGEMPAAPDFSAETHKRFRPKLAQVVELAEAGDIAGLEAFEINPVSSSPKAIAKFRDLAVIALKARKEVA